MKKFLMWLNGGYMIERVGTVKLGWRELVMIDYPSGIAQHFGATPRERKFLLRPNTATEWFEVDANGKLTLCDVGMRVFLRERLDEYHANQTFQREQARV